jgi:hypothetical protein
MAAVVLGGCGAGAPASRLGSLRSPAHILAQTAAALDRVHSFHLQGTGMDAGGLPVTFSGDFSIPGRLALTISENGQTFALKLVGGDAYLRANAQYWVAAGSTANAVALLADRWVKVPVASAPGLAQFRALTEPSTLGRCAIESGLGTVTVGGNTVIDGVPAVVLIDHGDLPGTSPGRLYVATSGASLPLLVTQSGPERPGGAPDRACGQTQNRSSSGTSSSLIFSRYDLPLRITAPAQALDLSQLKAAAKATAPKPAPTNPLARAAESAQETEMMGSWLATGRVIESRNSDESPGTIFDRAWRIARICVDAMCQPYITRNTNQGLLSAQLVWAGGQWAADFVSTIPRGNGEMTTDYSDWTIKVRPAGIDAVERRRTTASCGPPASTLRH